MNFYGTTVGPQHTLFGRVPPLLEAMQQAISRAAGQPLPAVEFAETVPDWIHNICNELTRTVFKGVIKMAPVGQEYDARKAGQYFGLLIRMAIFWWREAEVIWEQDGLAKLTPEKEKRLEKMAGWELACVHASKVAGRPITTKGQLIRFWKRRASRFISRTVAIAWFWIKFTLRRPVGEILEFLNGIPEGFKCFLNAEGRFAKTGKRTEIFFLLLMYWPEIEEMRQAQPPRTRKFLLDWLEKQEGKQLVESDMVFFALCDDISLDMAPPGHPFEV